MVPLRIFCLARKASSVRAITSTIALPMPRTSNRVAAMRKLPAKMRAHYSDRIARGNRAPQMEPHSPDSRGGRCASLPSIELGRDTARMTARWAANYNGCGGQPPMSLARDVTTVGGATLASRLLGFARDVGIAAALGAGVPSDAFFAVLQIANFFRRLLAEGALNAAFVPLWLRIKETQGENGAYAFFRQVLGASP